MELQHVDEPAAPRARGRSGLLGLRVSKDSSSSEEEEDEFPASPPARTPRQRRASVSVEAQAIMEMIEAKKPKKKKKKKVAKTRWGRCRRRVKKKMGACRKRVLATLNGSSETLGRALVRLAWGQILFLVLLIGVTGFEVAQAAQLDQMFAVMGIVGTCIGVLGVKFGERELLMLYFVLLVWGIARMTTSVVGRFMETVRLPALCISDRREELQGPTADTCMEQLVLMWCSIALWGVVILLTVQSMYIAMRLSEQLQEDAEVLKKEEKERVKRVIANMQARAKKEEKLKKDIAARKSRKKGARPSSVEGLRPGSTASTASSAGSNSRV